MKTIKYPESVSLLLENLWVNHIKGNKFLHGGVYMVDLPEPTEEEKRIMAANRASRKPLIMDEETWKTALEKAAGELGGW